MVLWSAWRRSPTRSNTSVRTRDLVAVGDIIGRLEERRGVDRDPRMAGDPPLVRARQLGRSCAEHKDRLADQGSQCGGCGRDGSQTRNVTILAIRHVCVFTHSGLRWREACLRPKRNPRPVTTRSKPQARQADPVARWQHYEPYLGILARVARRRIGSAIGCRRRDRKRRNSTADLNRACGAKVLLPRRPSRPPNAVLTLLCPRRSERY